MVSKELKKIIRQAIQRLQEKDLLSEKGIPEIKVEFLEKKDLGDYTTNVSFLLAKREKKGPSEIGELIKKEILKQKPIICKKVKEVNGFLNFFLSEEILQKKIEEILNKGEKFGLLNLGRGKKVNVEFISANPTGPLHVGNARGGFLGDVLSNVLQKAGYEVVREYYVNDMGRQILFLENSLKGKQPSYKNEYIEELKRKKEKDAKKAVRYIVKKIKETTKRMGINFDVWTYESKLEKERKECLSLLGQKGLLYEKNKTLWFRSSQFGDEKDRVLIRSPEKTLYSQQTYFLSDLAYLKNKFDRGFHLLFIFLGAEHHGYTPRLRAGAKALGYDQEKIKTIVFQLVKLFEKGKEIKMSKRTGHYITIDELLDEIKLDVARFFFLSRGYDRHLLFDLDLAKEQSEKNPVFYIQYANARIHSILARSKIKKKKQKADLGLLTHFREEQLIKQLIRFPEIVEETARDYQLQRIPQYALDLATAFHQFYKECQVLTKNKELREARLSLILAAKIVLKNTLSLMGISAPEKM